MAEPVFCFTSDVDWASEFCIRELRTILDEFQIHPTIFVTHRSEEIERWAGAELGIHPNFLPGSSHGSSVQEVIAHVLGLVPSAKSFRSHCFFDNSHVTRALRGRGLQYDSNLCLHLQPGIVPLRHSSGLTRFPVFFEDDVTWENPENWDMDLDQFFTPGLKILNFHPFMVAINCPDAAFYQDTRKHIATLDAQSATGLRHDRLGERDFLLRLLGEVKRRKLRFHTLGELFENASR
ncbi:MAG: hypothetical protein C0484_13855 [Rhodospirillum sp.]|nr:hypothetical protein [Rhodospirillum sp.]